ncbi:MAG TPA: sensor domain-containing diguanylate cyclase [Gammaproteobacteria bacterium]|nr:sensor domain-containing diguanylate cyclase [Gammaproteobacteria bacterium]
MSENLSPKHAVAIVEHIPFPVVLMDRQGCVCGYNPAFEQLVGRLQASDLQGRNYSGLVNHPVRMLLGSDRFLRWTDRNDAEHHFEVHCIELPGEACEQARLYVDVSKQVELEQAQTRLNEELKQHVLTDPVTGLLNSRGIVLALEPQVARSRRYNSAMSVIMMEVHCEGDQEPLLLHVARLLKDQLRWADLIGCNEQRELILVLPETTEASAQQLGGKLERLLAEASDEIDAGKLGTCYGVAGWRKKDNAGTLLRRAGMALSEARARQTGHAIAL